MPKRLNPKRICQACLLHWRGDSLTDIAVRLDVAKTTLSRWRKTQIWQDYEVKLIDEWHQRQHENTNPQTETTATQNT